MRPIRFLLAALVAAALAAPVSAATLRVFSTGSVKGELRDCGCKGKPLGGLAKRATVIAEEMTGADAYLLVDAGNFADTKDDLSWDKTLFLYEAMAEMGYDAVTPGDRELVWGLDKAKELFSSQEVPAVSANLTDAEGNLVWPAYVVVEKNGLRIGITGVTGSAGYGFNVTRGVQKVDDIEFLDPKEALRGVLPTLRQEKVDAVVVLANDTAADVKRMVDELPGADLVVVGYNPGFSFSPERYGNTVVVRGGDQGKYLSVTDLTMEGGKLTDYNGEGKPLNKTIADEPRIDDMVIAWEKAHGVFENKVEESESE